MSKSKEVTLNVHELKGFLGHIISNNRSIQQKGKVPVAVEVVGDSGIGKTSAIIQIAQEHDLDFVKLNLAQIEEIGDLVGFPIRQFLMSYTFKDGEIDEVWVDENATQEYVAKGYTFLGKNRMSYCPPEWIANKTKGGILLLDDWNRADIRFIQAVMELIDRQQYISWSLPQDWHIILTSNPDNGEYIVNTIDPAQRTRFISTRLKFDAQIWSQWAEANEIDGRGINFVLLHPEIVDKSVNARSIVMFFNSISTIENFESSLPLIQMIGEGSVGETFSVLFALFINNRLDKLITPEQMVYQDIQMVIETLKKSIGTKDSYRADIAFTIATRLINYVSYIVVNKNVDPGLIDRIANLILSGVFAEDIAYNIVKQIYNSDPKFKKMTMNKDLVKYTLK